MPVVANGDLFSLSDCKRITAETKVRGVMCARGLLANPAMFADHEHTPIECIRDWIDISLKNGTTFHYFHQVLSQMLTNVLLKNDRRYFNTLVSTSSVLDFLNENVLFQ